MRWPVCLLFLCLLILGLGLAGCAPVLLSEDGLPCDADVECEGVCWQGLCHGEVPRPCDPSALIDAPCLRPRHSDEADCRDVRAGTWLCTASGETDCRVIERAWREIENDCDDDQDGEVDEVDPARLECDDSRERIYFEGYEGIMRVALDTTQLHYGDGAIEPVDPVNIGAWRSPAWIWGHRPWTWASDCPVPDGAPESYAGRWVRWRLPRLPAPTAVSIEVLQHEFAPAVRDAGQFGSQLHATLRTEAGTLRPLAPALIIYGGSALHPARWECVPLPAGATDLFVFDHDPRGCPCDAAECPVGPAFAPTDLLVELWRTAQ